MYAQYLDEHISEHLSNAIANAAINNEQDPIDYIGKYLLKIIYDQKQNKKTETILNQWNMEDKKLNEEILLQKQKNDDALNKLKEMNTLEEEFFKNLNSCQNKIEAMKQWCDFIANKTDSTTVYIGHMCNIKQNDEDVNGLSNIAVSEGNEYLYKKCLKESETCGITIDLLKDKENNDDAGDEENKQDKSNETQERRKIYIDNVMLPNNADTTKDVYFYNYKKVGAFLAFECATETLLNEEALSAKIRPDWPTPAPAVSTDEVKEPNDEAKDNDAQDNPDDDEKKEEFEENPKKVNDKYAIVMDTLGTGNAYNDAQISWIDNSIKKLEASLANIDVQYYLKQRQFNDDFEVKNKEYTDKKEEMDKNLEEIATVNEGNEILTNFLKEYYTIKQYYPVWSLLSNYMSQPSPIQMKVMYAFVKLFNITELNLNDDELMIMDQRIWNQIRKCWNEINESIVNDFENKIKETDNDATKIDIELIENLCNIDMEQNTKIEIILSQILTFIKTCIAYYKEITKPTETENEDANQE